MSIIKTTRASNGYSPRETNNLRLSAKADENFRPHAIAGHGTTGKLHQVGRGEAEQGLKATNVHMKHCLHELYTSLSAGAYRGSRNPQNSQLRLANSNKSKGTTMKLKLMTSIGFVALYVLAGCNDAKSPGAVANDVAVAQEAAAKKVAEARTDASKDEAKAAEKVDDKNKDLNNVEAKGAYDVAMAKADGAYKVAVDKCNALGGDGQKKCKDMADADYTAAKANSKANEVAAKQ